VVIHDLADGGTLHTLRLVDFFSEAGYDTLYYNMKGNDFKEMCVRLPVDFTE
jgi:hypothetical protein